MILDLKSVPTDELDNIVASVMKVASASWEYHNISRVIEVMIVIPADERDRVIEGFSSCCGKDLTDERKAALFASTRLNLLLEHTDAALDRFHREILPPVRTG